MTGRRIAVIGGGLAGITAALDCARAGAEVTLFESRGRLGGAAYSFRHDGLCVDNGQHVFLRCCTAYRGLLTGLGASSMVTMQSRMRIPVLAPGGQKAILKRSGAPAPLRLAGSLARYRLLSQRDRLAVVRAMTALRGLDPDDPAIDARSFGEWLAEQGQSEAARTAVWDLISRPTLNLLPADASLAQAAQVFQVGLLRESSAADIGYARVPLSDIHDVAARRALAREDVDVLLRRGVSTVTPTGEVFQIEISGAPAVSAEAVIVAVPPDRAVRLLPAGTGIDPRKLVGLGRSPIVNLHVVYDRPVLDEPFVAAIASPVQWVFDRTGSSGATRGQYLAVSLSAAVEELSMTVDELRARYLPALGELLGHDAEVEAFFVTREHAATFAAAPGVRALRPQARTALPGLVLAGAWTGTGWPATMEGAVRSGHAAADAALHVRASGSSAHVRAMAAAGTSSATPEMSESGRLSVLAPMSLEARAVRTGAPWARVQPIGIGGRRAGRAAAAVNGGQILLAGFCGALDPRLAPGDLVLADQLIAGDSRLECANPTVLASTLRQGGLRVWVGPLASAGRPVAGQRRQRMAMTGALGVDMESASLADRVDGRRLTVLRAVLDTGRDELYRPLRAGGALIKAYRSLRRAAELLEDWADALAPREVLLATPRASCAGVERAVQIVERVLEQDGPPVYVRKQIVHNSHVIAELEARGAVFVDEVDEVPRGSTVIFSAHGVSPQVRTRARERGLRVIDATCPLVNKVHAEARRFDARGYDIVLVGHYGHEEVEGTSGEAPERTKVIASPAQVQTLEVEDPSRVAYLTQTTLALDDTAEVVDALKARFPELTGPSSSDICYATQNRQDAVRAVAAECDLVLVIGSKNSSNSQRLVEVAERAGTRALLIEDGGDLAPRVLAGVRRIGVTAGASAPETLVTGLIQALSGVGDLTVSERRVAKEDVRFKLPAELRGRD